MQNYSRQAQMEYESGKIVVIDYVVLGDYIKDYQRAFGKDLKMRVLLPETKVNAHRDKYRDCWTAGHEHVAEIERKIFTRPSLNW